MGLASGFLEYNRVKGSPVFTGEVTATFDVYGRPSVSYLFKLPTGFVGSVLSILPDVLIHQGFLAVEEITNYSLSVIQYLNSTPANITYSQKPDTFYEVEYLAGTDLKPDLILDAKYLGDSFFGQLVVPTLKTDGVDQYGVKYDYDDSLYLLVQGTREDYEGFSASYTGRALVVEGQVAGRRDAAWGDWLNASTLATTDPFKEVLDAEEKAVGAMGGFFDANKIGIRAATRAAQITAARMTDLAPGDQNLLLSVANTTRDEGLLGSWNSRVTTKTGLDESLAKKAVGHLGTAMTIVTSGYETYTAYKETGNLSQAVGNGSVLLLSGLLSGEVGVITGTAAGAATTTLMLGLGLTGVGIPILVGIAVGSVAAVGFEAALKASFDYWDIYRPVIPGSQRVLIAPDHVEHEPGIKNAAAAMAMTDADPMPGFGFAPGDPVPTALWEYNSDTGAFRWLDAAAGVRHAGIATMLGIAPVPIGLTLSGDQFAGTVDDYIVGAPAGDLLSGGEGSDVLAGEGGDDRLTGGEGADALFGDAGSDTLDGGAGGDLLRGGAGADRLTGGFGEDVFAGSVAELKSDAIADLRVGDRLRVDDLTFDTARYNRSAGAVTIAGGARIALEGDAAVRLVTGRDEDGGTVLSAANRYTRLADFDGDGHSDLLWRNADGTFTTWNVAGNARGDRLTPNTYWNGGVSAGWNLAATLDFNGDGRSDLLFREQSSGVFTIWNAVDGGFAANVYSFNGVGDYWTLGATGDFNGDGRDDILWRGRNGTFTEWQSTGTEMRINVYDDFASVSPDWTMTGTLDFNGDNRDDIMWRHGDGTFTIWTSNGDDFTRNTYYDNRVAPEWRIEGLADVNGDGRDDILWRHGDGTFTIWRAAGGGFAENVVVDKSVSPSWDVAQLGDFNGDGRADILWRNAGLGAFSTWESTGDGFEANIVYLSGVDGSWAIAAQDYP